MSVQSRFRLYAMLRVLKFNKSYFLIAIVLFLVEVLIAKYLHDRIIRPYIGDMLVAILIYAFVKSFLDTPVLPTALAVLAFAFLTETLQYFRIVHRLGLQDSKLARIIIGTSFEWADLLVYVIGIGIVLGAEAAVRRCRSHVQSHG
jgi:hypothetical protein